MPRVYKRKGIKNKWTTKQLEEATEKVRDKTLSVRAAAATYGIPRSTLSEHVRGVRSKRYGGGSTMLSQEEEREIVIMCQVLADMGFPLCKEYVEVVVRDYLHGLEGRGRTFGVNGLPGRSWWEGFMSRWPSLVQRKPQHLPKQRAQCATEEVVSSFFGRLRSLFQKTGLSCKLTSNLAQRIWNCDETGFCTAVASKSVLSRRGAKQVHETAGGSGRDFITVLGMSML